MKSLPKARLRKMRTWRLGPKPGELIQVTMTRASESLIDLASNDYLGLSRHPDLIEAAKTAMDTEGLGAGASRLITGSRPTHLALEHALANWLGRESVLLFPSGFQANLAAVIGLADRHTTVIADRYIHHSLLVGIKASGARLHRYNHNDLIDLAKHLELARNKSPKQSLLIVTESLFSMEGTSPDLKKITDLCQRFNAKLLVDEAHALGVLGPQGRGLCYGLSKGITIISGTFGKAFGGGGAFLATDKKIHHHLLQTSGAFRYTTAVAPALAASGMAALQLIKKNPDWSLKLQELALSWRYGLTNLGWEKPPGKGPILSLVIGEDQKALDLQHKLEKAGLLVAAIRPPTVPEGTSRLRIVVRKDLPDNTFNKLTNALETK